MISKLLMKFIDFIFRKLKIKIIAFLHHFVHNFLILSHTQYNTTLVFIVELSDSQQLISISIASQISAIVETRRDEQL